MCASSTDDCILFVVSVKNRHREIPQISHVVVKSGYLMKKGAHSSNYTKRCAVLLKDRIVIYENVGDPVALVHFGVWK